MYGTHCEASRREVFGHLCCGTFGTGEDDGFSTSASLQDAGGHRLLVHAVRLEYHLPGGCVCCGGICRFCPDMDWLGQKAACQGEDRAGHGRGEQHGLMLVGERHHDLLDVGQEPEVQHLIGFVQDKNGDLIQTQGPALEEIQESTRGSHDYIDTSFQGIDLLFVGGAAIEGEYLERQVDRGALKILTYLDSQLTGGNDNQGTRCAVDLFNIGGVKHPIKEGDTETIGFSHAGARLSDQVVSIERDGKGVLLDREGVGDAEGIESVGNFYCDTELCERGARAFRRHNLDTIVARLQ